MDLKDNKKEYNNSIAFLRVLATVCVVVGHVAADTDFKVAMFKVIYSFHIPLFVFISGYLMASGITKYNSFYDMINAKVRRLIVPYYIGLWTAILPCHLFFYKDVEWKFYSINSFMSSVPNEHLWFLWILFWIFVVTFHILKYIAKPYWWAGAVFVGILGGIFLLPLNANINLIRYSYYFVLGFVIGNSGNVLEYLRRHRIFFSLVVIVVTIGMVVGQIHIQKTYETYVGAWFITSHLKSYLCISTVTILDLYLLVEYFATSITCIMDTKIMKCLDKDSFFVYIYHLFAGIFAARLIIIPIFNCLPQNIFFKVLIDVVGVLSSIVIPIMIIEGLKRGKAMWRKCLINEGE